MLPIVDGVAHLKYAYPGKNTTNVSLRSIISVHSTELSY